MSTSQRTQHRFQALTASRQHLQRELDIGTGTRELLGDGGRELLTTDQIASEFKFPSAEAARKYLNRHDVPRHTRGRILLVARRDFMASMRKARKVQLGLA